MKIKIPISQFSKIRYWSRHVNLHRNSCIDYMQFIMAASYAFRHKLFRHLRRDWNPEFNEMALVRLRKLLDVSQVPSTKDDKGQFRREEESIQSEILLYENFIQILRALFTSLFSSSFLHYVGHSFEVVKDKKIMKLAFCQFTPET